MRTARTLEAEWTQFLRGSASTGANKDESSTGRVWTAGFHDATTRFRLARVLKLFNFQFFLWGCHEPRLTETADTKSVDTGAHLYLE
jgi:hypothetical protein